MKYSDFVCRIMFRRERNVEYDFYYSFDEIKQTLSNTSKAYYTSYLYNDNFYFSYKGAILPAYGIIKETKNNQYELYIPLFRYETISKDSEEYLALHDLLPKESKLVSDYIMFTF